MTSKRGTCRNRLYRWDEETMVLVCDDCGALSSNESELLEFHYWKISKGKLVSMKLPAEKNNKITEVI